MAVHSDLQMRWEVCITRIRRTGYIVEVVYGVAVKSSPALKKFPLCGREVGSAACMHRSRPSKVA